MNLNEKLITSKIKDYCKNHGIEFSSLIELINEPKLVPMIRGIGFEYVIQKYLDNLSKKYNNRFKVRKPNINAQFSVQDIDIEIFDEDLKKSYSLECKLSKNTSFRLKSRKFNSPYCQIKVMRSRTLGDTKIKETAQIEKISEKLISSHKDSYLPNKFDFVVTNLRNVFYRTTKDNLFVFSPTKEEINFLKDYLNTNNLNKINAYLLNNHFYIMSKKLSPKFNETQCSRKECPNPKDCMFIPNYPLFRMDKKLEWKNLKYIFDDLLQKT